MYIFESASKQFILFLNKSDYPVNCETCVDDPAFTYEGKECGSLIQASTKKLCYEPDVESSCCYSCTQISLNIPGRLLRDIKFDIIKVALNFASNVHSLKYNSIT